MILPFEQYKDSKFRFKPNNKMGLFLKIVCTGDNKSSIANGENMNLTNMVYLMFPLKIQQYSLRTWLITASIACNVCVSLVALSLLISRITHARNKHQLSPALAHKLNNVLSISRKSRQQPTVDSWVLWAWHGNRQIYIGFNLSKKQIKQNDNNNVQRIYAFSCNVTFPHNSNRNNFFRVIIIIIRNK